MQRPAVCTARHNRVREQAPAFASVLHDASAIISVKLAGDLSSHESSGHHQSMETPPLHVLLALDAQILGGEVGYGTSTPSDPVVSLTGHDDDGDEDGSPSPARDGPATVADEVEGTTRTAASSRFWGVTWHQENNKWLAQYRDADGKMRCIGHYDDEEEAARAYNDAISDAGLEGRNKRKRRWEAQYADANGKVRSLGYFDTQEDAAHAVNAAIRALPPDVQRRRHTNPVVDGQLVPRVRRRKTKKRRRDEAAATPSTRPRLD